MTVTVTRCAAGATLQGPPELGRRRFGVPVGGAFDRFALRLSEALLNVHVPGALEVPPPGITLRFDSSTVVAVTGVDAEIRVNDVSQGVAHRVAVPSGGVFEITSYQAGCRALVAWPGLAGQMGAGVRVGDLLPCQPCVGSPSTVRLSVSWTVERIRVLAGPDDADLSFLESSPFHVSVHSNRVGLRLVGEPGPILAEKESEPSAMGVLQLARDRQLLLIGPDGPTVGGYPKIATVISADLDKVARLRPGDCFPFAVVTLNEARQAAIDAKQLESDVLARLQIALAAEHHGRRAS